jgi:hypothetical protein
MNWVIAPVDGSLPPARSLWSSLRAALFTWAETMGRFTLANLIWLLAAVLTAVAGRVYPPAYALGLLLVPLTCGLARMAGHAARDHSVKLRHFRDGMRHRFWLHLALGVGQYLLLVVALVNVGVGMGGESLLFALVAIVSGYVALATGVVAAAAWPLLLDPQRPTMPWSAAIRLALAVIVKHPLGLVAVALIEAALIAAGAQTVVLGVFLPSYGTLLAAHYVLPLADRLEGRG